MRMVLLYILLIAYIIAINFYAFLQIKSMRDNEEKEAVRAEIKSDTKAALPAESAQTTDEHATTAQKQPQRNLGKLFITAALGGAITIYVCMFVLKYKRSDLLLMVLMPLLGVLNVYFWVLLFRSGFSFFLIR
jgi:Flp pilus assembly protein TadB